MDPPPSTQVTEPPPRIFVNDDDSPIQVFAEAGHIHARPQLVRRLKRFGAAICSDPKNAQIILVNPESTQGRLFVRNWGHDANKVVLDSAWAKKCFEAQKVFLEDDDYAGYMVIDDGRPIEDEGDEESGNEVAKSPLPTPRATPVEPALSRTTTHDRQRSIPPSQPPPTAPPPMPIPGPSLTSDVAPSTPSFNGMDMATMAQFMQQFATPPAMTQSAQMPLQSMMQQQAAMLQMFPYGVPQQNMQSDPFWLAVRDTMMNKGLYPSQAQPPTSQLPHSVYSQPVVASPVQQQVLPFPPIPSADESFGQYVDSPPRQPSVKPKGKHRASSPSAKRRKTSSGSFLEASTSSKPAKTNGSHSNMGPPAEKKLFRTRSGREIAFFVQVGGHNRFSLVQSIKKNGGNIVSNITDADYVILYHAPGAKTDKVHDSFLHQAISADLPAVPARFVTDCLEQNTLLDPEPYLFMEPVKTKRKRPAAKSASPMSPESEDEEVEVETSLQRTPNGYGHVEEPDRSPEEPQSLKIYIPAQSREKPHSASAENSTAYANGVLSDETSTPTKRRGPGRPRKVAQPPSPVKAVKIRPKPGYDNGPPSPTPPSIYNAVPWGNGYKFSNDENEFATAYAKILVERNHEVSLNHICALIHRKLPHHTIKSWRTHLATLFGSDLDEWRKRAGIAYRKARNATQFSTSTTPVASSSTLSIARGVSISDAEEPPWSTRVSTVSASESPPPIPERVSVRPTNQVILTALEADLTAISKFFAEGNDDQTESEEVIWAKLTSQATCNTESSWETFYQKHSNEVQTRYQNLVDAQALAEVQG